MLNLKSGLASACLLLCAGPAAAQSAAGGQFVTATPGQPVIGAVQMCLNSSNVAVPASSGTCAGGQPVSGSVAVTALPAIPAGSNLVGKVGIDQTTPGTTNGVQDPNNLAFQGAVAMTVGTTYAAQRSVAAICTVVGNMSVTFVDASTLVLPVQIGFQEFPFAVTAINTSGTTATCTYANLK